MSISCIPLKTFSVPCSYIEGNTFSGEHYIVQDIDTDEMDFLLRNGYRHFGYYFFRPMCTDCHACIPLRIPVDCFRLSASERRLIRKNRRFTVALTPPSASRQAFRVYKHHKRRFNERGEDSYEQFVESFFYPLPCSYQLSIYDGQRLICVSHIDITDTSLSAVYCYYTPDYHAFSLGSFAILKEIELARTLGLSYVFLGYYIAENRHMNYKRRFYPNQLFVREGIWIDYIDADGNTINPGAPCSGFTPKKPLITTLENGHFS